jgi:hypothetical protein
VRSPELASIAGLESSAGEISPKASILQVAENGKENRTGGMFLHLHGFVSLGTKIA